MMAPKDSLDSTDDFNFEKDINSLTHTGKKTKKWEDLDHIIDRLDRLIEKIGNNSTINRFSKAQFVHESEERVIRKSRAALPDPRLVRSIIRSRQARIRFFGSDLFADPAWDMLLDLTVARVEHRRVSVTSLCIASGVPTTTALRWIKLLKRAGLVERIEDDTDRRRAFVALTEAGADSIARYFDLVVKQWREVG